MSGHLLATALEPAPASGVFSLTWLIFVLPLVGAAVLLLSGRHLRRSGPVLACLLPAVSFAIGLAELAALLGHRPESRAFVQDLYSWIPVGDFQVSLGLLVDPLSICFVLLITGIGTVIHVYSLGYMAGDQGRKRFFGYMNLFVAAMLLLVLADNYLVTYVGWEGVGLASYLLIGFWSYKPTAAVGAKKAFLMNRVGDFGFSVAIMIMFATLGTTAIPAVNSAAGEFGPVLVTALGLLLLLGACAKSAQVPLQAWLLDAMEGPTPVSALIHAATMVTAGVYLLIRAHPILEASTTTQLTVAVVGAVTLLWGALIGCAKDDIKRSLAGSTISQVGYMVLAVGLGPIGYAFAMAHLLAHGFFKAALFLDAGSVMHAMNDESDMRKYGGLRRYMPITFWTFVLAWAAIIGVPGFAGWWTKDKIIEATFGLGGPAGLALGAAALLGVALTAFYMTRMLIMTFFGGEDRWEPGVQPHESPPVMTTPLVLLSVGSVGAGAFLVYGERLAHFLEPAVGFAEPAHVIPPTVVTLLALLALLLGVGAAYAMYVRERVQSVAPAGNALVTAGRENLYADAFNETVFMLPGQYLTRLLVFFDNRGIDGVVNGIAALVGGTSSRVRRLQTGFVRSYAMSMFVGAAVVVAAMLLVRL